MCYTRGGQNGRSDHQLDAISQQPLLVPLPVSMKTLGAKGCDSVGLKNQGSALAQPGPALS